MCAGLATLADLLTAGEAASPPIHLVTGTGTTLGQLANLATSLANTRATLRIAPPRTFDVSQFVGDPTLAHQLLGWKPHVPLQQGLQQLITDFQQHYLVHRPDLAIHQARTQAHRGTFRHRSGA